MDECEAELKKMMALKTEKIGELIKQAKKELAILYLETFTPDPDLFGGSSQDKDSLLKALEQEITRVKGKKEALNPILGGVEKYYRLVQERVEYEEIIKDSSRLMSRRAGSALREEEQMRLRVSKTLPALVEKLSRGVKVS